ncbi:MAG: hypothetical protein NVS3B25_01190 [Hymenobacter sp.]
MPLSVPALPGPPWPAADVSPDGRGAAAHRPSLDGLVRDAPACVASLSGPTLVVTVANPLFRQLFGERTLAGLPLREALPELRDQPFFALLDEVYATGVICHSPGEVLFVDVTRPDPRGPVHFTFIAQAMREAPAGTITGLLLFAYNVSAHVRRRQQAEGCPQPATTAAQLALANEALAITNEELTVTIAELDATNDQLTETNRHLAQANVDLKAANADIRAHAAELHLSQKALRQLNRQLEKRVAERTGQLQAALRDSEQQRATIAAVFDQTPAAVCLLRGPELRFEYVNDSYQRLYPGRPLQGCPLAEALPEAEAQGFIALLDQVYATGEPYHGQEISMADAGPYGPRICYFDFTYQAFRENGAVVGVAVCALDVSEQVRARQLLERLGQELATAYATLQVTHVDTELANAALNQSITHLTRTNADLDSFVYAASHDLKLPVLNLAGLIGELRRGVTFTDPAEESVLMPLIEQTLRQLTATLDDLAALGQMQQAAPAEPLALEEVVQDVLQVLEPQLRAARARVTVDFAARPVVSYPRASLRTIVLNLLSNAFKYADPARPCRVHVALWLDAGQPVLWVKDNGLGFDAVAHGPEMFQLFRRFHAHPEGTGVGLYLVNRLVQVSGGHLEVDSRVGEGATFRVYLGHV